MPPIADYFFKSSVVFLILGIAMGLQMSISGEHNVTVSHAHTNLLGWVTMAIFGGYYALNPVKAATRLARIHFWSYFAAVAVLSPGLYFFYLGYAAVEPLLAVSSILAFVSVVLFAVVVFSRSGARADAHPSSAPVELP